jgi:hypothetical protein
MSKKTVLSSTAAAIAALALSGAAFAAGQQGISVVKDAATGEMRAPTAEEAQQLRNMRIQQKAAATAAAAARSRLARGAVAPAAAPLPPGTVIRHPNGMDEIIMDPESISFAVATRDANGNTVMQCVTGATAAAKAVANPVTTHSEEHQHDVK